MDHGNTKERVVTFVNHEFVQYWSCYIKLQLNTNIYFVSKSHDMLCGPSSSSFQTPSSLVYCMTKLEAHQEAASVHSVKNH